MLVARVNLLVVSLEWFASEWPAAKLGIRTFLVGHWLFHVGRWTFHPGIRKDASSDPLADVARLGETFSRILPTCRQFGYVVLHLNRPTQNRTFNFQISEPSSAGSCSSKRLSLLLTADKFLNGKCVAAVSFCTIHGFVGLINQPIRISNISTYWLVKRTTDAQ